MLNIEEEKTKFHGSTYNEELDRKRFTGQLRRIAQVLQDGEWIDALTLCERAGVSFSAVRNRLSDLRVYHGFKIEAVRIKDGLWRYRYTGTMPPEEHQKYLVSLKVKKFAGDALLWGKMWEAIYAFAFHADAANEAELDRTSKAWAMNLAHDIHLKNKSI